MKYNMDLHIHSPYSAATAKDTTIELLSKHAKLKGINILGTGDILHPFWYEHCKDNLIEKNGSYYYREDFAKNKTYFMLTTEVETKGRVHHLLIFKNLKQAFKFRKVIEKYSTDMNKYGGGRPRLSLTPKELLILCIEYDVILGPAHAFTPYFGIYATNDSLKEVYEDLFSEIKFIELGLSADTKTANTIPELENIKFFSFSDAHSSSSYRLGREFVCVELEEPNFESLKCLLDNKDNNYIVYNIGYFPQEGKYNKTACKKCKKIHSLKDAIKFKWKCSKCKSTLKKGVEDRIKEIAKKQGNEELKQIKDRPEYKYVIPLIEIIQTETGKKGMYNKSILDKYTSILVKYNEIEILLSLPEEELNKIDKDVSKLIMAYRRGLVVFRPGGGGHYGEFFICSNEEEKKKKEKEIEYEQQIRIVQKTLF